MYKIKTFMHQFFNVTVMAEKHKQIHTKVTWLILPVVICLFQRLSHACLSINIFIPWNCVQLIISVILSLMVFYYMDNRSNSRANTCHKISTREGRDGFIRYRTNDSNIFWWFMITLQSVWLYVDASSFKFLPYQLSYVRYWLT